MSRTDFGRRPQSLSTGDRCRLLPPSPPRRCLGCDSDPLKPVLLGKPIFSRSLAGTQAAQAILTRRRRARSLARRATAPCDRAQRLGQRGLELLEGIDDVAECERLHLLEHGQSLDRGGQHLGGGLRDSSILRSQRSQQRLELIV
eukprot:scaffold118200_cov54-Phaeocystis_antarctica.AAC.3